MRRLLLLLPVTLSLTGCSWWIGTIPPKDIAPELKVQASKKLKPLQLATLGVPVQSEYRIQPGDLLDVTVSDLYEENRNYTIPARVQEDGTIRLPLAGTVQVSSLTAAESEQVVFTCYCGQGLLRNPQVTVTPKQTGKVRVSVLGSVQKPGQYELNNPEADLLSALVAAGGLKEDAGTIVEIRRRVVPEPVPMRLNAEGNRLIPVGAGAENAGPVVPAFTPQSGPPAATAPQPFEPQLFRLDLTSEEDQHRLTQGIRLRNGDIVSIQDRKKKPVYVMGMVNKPGEYQVPPDRDLRVLEAVGLAGGVDHLTMPDKVIIIRTTPDESGLVAIRIDLNEAKKNMAENIRLMPGDVVSVEETVFSYMRGLLRGALRFGVGASLTPAAF